MAMPINEWDEMPWQKIDKEYISSMECEAFYSVGYDIDPNNRKRYILMARYEYNYLHFIAHSLDHFRSNSIFPVVESILSLKKIRKTR